MAKSAIINPYSGSEINLGGYTVQNGDDLTNSSAALLQSALNKSQFDYEYQKYSDYNDPSFQMQAFKNAGLNPNLIYAKQLGSFNAGSSAGMPSSTSKTMAAIQGLDTLLGFASDITGIVNSSRLANAQVNMMNAQTSNLGVTGQYLEDYLKGRNKGIEDTNDFNRSANPIRLQILGNQKETSNYDAIIKGWESIKAQDDREFYDTMGFQRGKSIEDTIWNGLYMILDRLVGGPLGNFMQGSFSHSFNFGGD